MATEKRSRTGCLSCRARRIKCDEHKPTCKRCETANIDCAGYQQKRRVQLQRSRGAQLDASSLQTLMGTISSSPHSTCSSHVAGAPTAVASVADSKLSRPHGNDIPLVALPNNPRPGHRPGREARCVLGYHQFLFRTLPVLFPLEDLCFWRDELCEEAWGCEYMFLTLTALGSMHRAVLMMSMPEEIDQKGGTDLRVTTIQVYTQALQELSIQLNEAKKTPRLLVAVLCLMAYFESFNGNIPAFVGHLHSAKYYMTSLVLANTGSNINGGMSKELTAPLETCLNSLRLTCHLAVPFPRLLAVFPTQNFIPRSSFVTHNLSTVNFPPLRELLDLVCADAEIEELIWCPIHAYTRRIQAAVIHRFQEQLCKWRSRHEHRLPELISNSALESLLRYKWERFPMPPPGYSSIMPSACLTAAHYSFYMARLHWSLCLLDEDKEANQISAEFYFYEAMRFATTHANRAIKVKNSDDSYVPCEALNAGFLTLLHVTGLCSPRPSWLHWIGKLCTLIEQEGVLKGHTYATNLDCLRTFEMYSQSESPALMERFPDPANRVICQLIPEIDGRHYTSYFAHSTFDADNGSDRLTTYRILGHARWRCYFGEHACEPEVEIYDKKPITTESFADWLLCQQAALDWARRSKFADFDMDRALRDHINGSRLLPPPGEVQASV